MTTTTFRRITVSAADVLAALEDFDTQYPDTNAYEGWLDKSNYTYALCCGDRMCPPNHILSVVTGIPTTDFSGGESTNRVFRQLGFEVRDK